MSQRSCVRIPFISEVFVWELLKLHKQLPWSLSYKIILPFVYYKTFYENGTFFKNLYFFAFLELAPYSLDAGQKLLFFHKI